jgi:cation transport regulator
MPYGSNADLPPSVRLHLPTHAQDIFREAFNHAWNEYASEGARREEAAFRVAWAAVKKGYRKRGDTWVSKDGS